LPGSFGRVSLADVRLDVFDLVPQLVAIFDARDQGLEIVRVDTLALCEAAIPHRRQPLDSLAPLEGFALEALFLTNTRLADQDLSAIATMPNIRFLGTGINAPRAQFFALRDAKPELECQWFDERVWADFRDPKPPKR
jgi:hypothetical protein